MKMKDNKKIPVTLNNLHELLEKIPPEQFEKNREKIDKRMKESKKFWEEKSKEK